MAESGILWWTHYLNVVIIPSDGYGQDVVLERKLMVSWTQPIPSANTAASRGFFVKDLRQLRYSLVVYFPIKLKKESQPSVLIRVSVRAAEV